MCLIKKVYWVACLSVIAFTALGLPAEIRGKVSAVLDGNTIEFTSVENETFKLVLSGIDCPELDQEFGDEAKRFMERMAVGKEALVIREGKDRLGNRVGSLLFDNNRDPRVDLLEKGLAWTAERNPKPEFDALKESAKNRGKGLWKQENPIAPWTFRRQQSMLTAKSG